MRCNILLVLLPLCALAQPKYMIQDLGALPSPNTSCTGTAISQSGNVTGYCNPPGGAIFTGTSSRGFIFANGKMTDLGPATSQAPIVPTGVNDSGVVVGTYVTISLIQGLGVAPFIYQNGAIQSFNGVPPNTAPFGLTNTGQTVGAEVAAGATNFFVSSTAVQIAAGGATTHLQPTSGSQSAAFGISPSGEWAAGGQANVGGGLPASIKPIVWQKGAGQALPSPAGFNFATAFAVNDSGTAAGTGFTFDFSTLLSPNGSQHAMLFSNGTATDLGTLPADKNSGALGINNSGDVVGFSTSQTPDISLFFAPYLEAAASGSHAFIYTKGVMYDLNRQLVNGAGWQLTSALGINDAGQIAGTGIIQQQQHAFLLTPVTVTAPQVNSVVGAGLTVPAVNSLSANGLFTIFGTGFADPSVKRNVGASDLTNGALPTNLANVCVTGGNTRWALIYVSALQINAVADPLTTSGTVPISVISNCDQPNQATSSAVNVNVAAETPQFFLSGQNEVAATDALTGAQIGPTSLGAGFAPAHAGEIVTVYCTGLGATSPAAVVGTLAPGGTSPLASTNFTLTVGGKTAVVSYAGLTPTYSGLYQINFTVPDGLTAGNQPIVFTVDGVETPAGALLAVQ